MKDTPLFLPGFHLAVLRRKPRSAAQRLADEKARIRQHSISQATGRIPALRWVAGVWRTTPRFGQR
jgi:hypothetical protein